LVLKAVKEQDLPTAVNIVDSVGLAIFLYYLILIYVKRPKGLITTGLFKYTRHPMYTGMLMMAIRLWWPSDPGYTADYWVTIALFLIGVFTAGYLQEKETLSRFGQEAEDYYRRTPRLFLLYPFR
jgi:protein-S-isoprenylcysteine O-methyltransferase Ste14